MKRLIPVVAALVLLAGCGLIPKKVEFFQTDVPRYPSKTSAHIQAERQTAARLAEKTRETKEAAIQFDAPWDVVYPAQEASELAGALSTSLGPPERPWKGTTDALAAKLEAQAGKQDTKLDKLEAKLDKVEGKNIEGTGKFQVPYLTWLLIVGGGIITIFLIGKTVLAVAAHFSPEAALANAGLDIPLKGFTQLVKGGGKFIDQLPSLGLGEKAEAAVKSLFVSTHKQTQDEDVKSIVRSLPGSVTL